MPLDDRAALEGKPVMMKFFAIFKTLNPKEGQSKKERQSHVEPEFGKILHDPNIIVYHHRRTFPFGHLKQIGSVGLHRGYFFKKYPQTSRGTFYLLPTILTLGFISGIVLVVRFPQLFALPFVLVFLFFLLLGTISVYRHKVDITSSLIASIAIMMTHMSYGVFFVKGLLTHHLNK